MKKWRGRRRALLLAGVFMIVLLVVGVPIGPIEYPASSYASSSGCNSSMPVEKGGSSPALAGPLVVVGNQICDSHNSDAQVILKGVNRPGMEKVSYPNNSVTFPSQAEINAMHAWGANFVRVGLSSDLWNQTCALETYDAQYRSKVSQLVQWITSDQMLALLDIGYTNPNCYFKPANTGFGWSGGEPLAMPGQDVATALTSMAQTFSSNNLVAYELYNEPHVCVNSSGKQVAGSAPTASPCSWSDAADSSAWANGGNVTDPNLNTYASAGMSQLYAAVRSQTSNLIFADSNFYAGDPSTFTYWTLQSPTNLVYVFHYYPCQATSATQGTCYNAQPEECSQIDTGSDLFGQFGLQYYVENQGSPWSEPVVIDEFGWPEGSEATGQPPSYPLNLSTGGQLNIYGYGYELNNVISYLDQQGVGWAAFAWDGGANPQGVWQIVSSYSTYTPNVDGNPIYDSLQGQSLNCENPPSGYV